MVLNKFKWGLLWSLFILFVCLLPGNNLPESSFLADIYFDKLIHGFLYCVLFILVLIGIKGLLKSPFLISFIYCTLYGVLIEVIQHFLIKDRMGEVYDIYANLVGIFIGIIIATFKKNNETNEPIDNLSL